jgi:hypothetical protein
MQTMARLSDGPLVPLALPSLPCYRRFCKELRRRADLKQMSSARKVRRIKPYRFARRPQQLSFRHRNNPLISVCIGLQ